MVSVELQEPLKSLLGPLERGAITTFYGEAGAGKTNLCIIACVNCCKKGGKAIYIDTEGGFSVERLRQIAGSDAEEVLKRIKVVEPKTFGEQKRVVKELRELTTDLVIVDSAVALYRLEYAEEKSDVHEANRQLSIQLSTLLNLAKEKDIPVIITSHVYKNWDNGETRIVGGDSIKYWSKSLVFLEKTGKMSERRATLVKHRYKEEGKSVKFLLCNEGIRPVGFKLFL